MIIKDITSHLESIAPLKYQAEYDNSGLIVGNENDSVQGALITLDCTEEVVEEAIRLGVNLIIAHHPIVFSGLKKLNGSNYVERTVLKAIENKIAIYAIHTNLDAVPTGVNAKIGSLLGLNNLLILSPDSRYPEVGAGMIGELDNPMDFDSFITHLKSRMKLPAIRHTKALNGEISKVAFCGGSGSFLIDAALSAEADVFISSDIKYHQFFDADNQMVIIDAGHYEMEVATKDLIYEILSEKFRTFTLHFSEIITNPINYL